MRGVRLNRNGLVDARLAEKGRQILGKEIVPQRLTLGSHPKIVETADFPIVLVSVNSDWFRDGALQKKA